MIEYNMNTENLYKVKISIIVPLYKAEPYIQECNLSIQAQTYKNIEVIFVDDGSPDRSGIIADSLSREYNNIKVIHKSNGGASSARNAGVEMSNGEYLLFVDSDDFLRSHDSLERIVTCAAQNNFPDIVGFNIMYYYPSSNHYKKWVEYDTNITNANDKDILIQELVKTGTLPVSPCGKLIKREYYLQSRISFIEGTIAEDIPWTIKLFEMASTICFMSEYHYCYRQEVATSVTGNHTDKKFIDLVTVIENLIPLIDNTKFNNLTKEHLLSFAAYELCIAMGGLHRLNKTIRMQVRDRLKHLAWLLNYTQNPKVLIASRVYRVFGYAITEKVLRLYKWYRSIK